MSAIDGARRWLRRMVAGGPSGPAAGPAPGGNLYEQLYEAHARALPDTESIGAGDFDLVGRLELRVLQMEGLAPTHALVDFGCGTGRLAVHAVPYLVGGRYVGIDIAEPMLEQARSRVRQVAPSPPCAAAFVKHATTDFPLPDASADVICAFSVFTHMEHEDTFRYLQDARRVVRPGGRFVLSCLPVDTLEYARHIFRESAKDDFETRWSRVRNVATSTDLMESLARLAGWTVARWIDGNARAIELPDAPAPYQFGQSILVLDAPAPG